MSQHPGHPTQASKPSASQGIMQDPLIVLFNIHKGNGSHGVKCFFPDPEQTICLISGIRKEKIEEEK